MLFEYSFHVKVTSHERDNSRRNDGRLRDRDLKKYQHIELGGWWCSGVDPLNNYVLMM